MEHQWNGHQLIHGGDYNPEQWLDRPDILEKDLEYFQKAHINEVSIGIFSWAMLEPEEGRYEFGWMEKIIDCLYEHGVMVMLATPSGARPKWLADQYPEVLRVAPDRSRNLFGGRHNHCYTSPVYRAKTRAINYELAQHFGKHPAVIAWHISNELGGDCHCPLCQTEFRQWLKKKYETIEELNRCWCTTFWSHCYTSFEQIESPSPRGERMLHGLNLDWKRFVTDQTGDFLKHEIQAVRDGGGLQPATVNLMYDYVGLNYHKIKDLIDVVSWDSYPTWHKAPESITAMDTGMQHDLMRALKGKPFWLMESCPSSTNWQGVSKLKRPGMLLASSLQAIAHGSDSVQYFQIRKSRGASEKFHGAVIDHYGGDDTRVFQEVTEVGEALAALSELAGSNTLASAAVIYDTENKWALEDAQGPRNSGIYYKESVEKSYSALRRLGLDVDVIDMDSALDRYEVIAAPMLYLFSDGFEEKVRNFVERGGIFFLTYWSGIVDTYDRCFLGGTPHGLMDVMGLRSTEIDALYDGEENQAIPAKGNSAGLTETYICNHLCDLIQLDTAEILMTYGKDFYQGQPAFTRNQYGKGNAYYICADMEPRFYADAFSQILTQLCPSQVIAAIPEGVEVTHRYGEHNIYTIVQNFSGIPQNISFAKEAGPLLYGTIKDGMLENYQTIVCRKSRN